MSYTTLWEVPDGLWEKMERILPREKPAGTVGRPALANRQVVLGRGELSLETAVDVDVFMGVHVTGHREAGRQVRDAGIHAEHCSDVRRGSNAHAPPRGRSRTSAWGGSTRRRPPTPA